MRIIWNSFLKFGCPGHTLDQLNQNFWFTHQHSKRSAVIPMLSTSALEEGVSKVRYVMFAVLPHLNIHF